MSYKFFSYGEQLKALNGNIVDNKKYDLKLNPYNKNNVFLSINDNGNLYNKSDTLEDFFKGMKYENIASVDSNPFIQNLKTNLESIKKIKHNYSNNKLSKSSKFSKSSKSSKFSKSSKKKSHKR